jgi:hypothetical protein
VTQIRDDSEVIRSFILEPADSGGVVPHEPGQVLPIRVRLDEGAAPAGSADYPVPPSAAVPPGEALLCSATPHPGLHLADGPNRAGVTLDL